VRGEGVGREGWRSGYIRAGGWCWTTTQQQMQMEVPSAVLSVADFTPGIGVGWDGMLPAAGPPVALLE